MTSGPLWAIDQNGKRATTTAVAIVASQSAYSQSALYLVSLFKKEKTFSPSYKQKQTGSSRDMRKRFFSFLYIVFLVSVLLFTVVPRNPEKSIKMEIFPFGQMELKV